MKFIAMICFALGVGCLTTDVGCINIFGTLFFVALGLTLLGDVKKTQET